MPAAPAVGLPQVESHEPPPPSLTGVMHDSRASMPDAPLLVLRLAQTKLEWTKLQEFLRGCGLGTEGQISQPVLKAGLHKAGLAQQPDLAAQIEEIFLSLDPDLSGTIGFSELTAEVRRVRKLLPSGSPHAAARRLPRGGSAPVARARPSAGLQHGDGSAYSAHELRLTAEERPSEVAKSR